MRKRDGLFAYILTLAAAACMTACQQAPPGPAVAHGSLPPLQDDLKFAGIPLPQPFMKQPGNYFSRVVYETDGPGNSHIEVRDVLIPPQSKATLEALPGSVVMEPVSGKLSVTSGEKPEAITQGAMRALPAGKTVDVENADSRAANIRLYVIRAR